MGDTKYHMFLNKTKSKTLYRNLNKTKHNSSTLANTTNPQEFKTLNHRSKNTTLQNPIFSPSSSSILTQLPITMNTHSQEGTPSPSPHIHLSTSSSGYSVPIRAPLTIDSDSELDLPISHQIYSRTSSFNSSSSIDISSYGEEEESGGFEAYPYGEIVIERSFVEESCFNRPFVRYPDGNYVKERGNASQSAIFRPFVRIPCEESVGGGGGKLSVPIAPLTGDFDDDGESDIGSVDGGAVQKVAMAPKVRSFDDDDEGDCGVDDELQVEGVFSGDDTAGIEFFSEVVKLSESGASSFELERIDVQTVLRSNNEIETETVNQKVSESDEMCFDLERMYAHIVSNSDSEIENLNSVSRESIDDEGCKVECLNEVVKFSETGALNFVSDRINSLIVSNSDSEIDNLNYVSSESIDDERCKVECLNEVVKLSDAGASCFDLERIDSQAVSSSIHEKLSESDELCFGSDIIDTQIVSNLDSEIEHLNTVPTESIAKEGCKVECLNEFVKLSESPALGIDLERTDAQAVSSSNSEIELKTINVKLSESDDLTIDSERINSLIVSNSDSEIDIKTINETEQEAANKKKEEMLTRMQRVRAKFLRLALNEQLTREVNGEGRNYKFDFHLTILAIGKTGVGKSATINTIFGENRATTNAFDPGTTTIQELTGNVDGIQLRVIDTPGLKCSSFDLSYNLRVLKSIKRFTRRHTPDVVLYVDRLDTREVNDSHLLKLITGSLGSSVWCHCIIALTHAGYDPLNEPSGAFVVQRCHFIQEQIFSCVGDDRRMANPVWLVDNHASYKHDIMDLDCGLKSLACLDQANEDEECDQVPPFDLLSEPRDIVNRSRERRDAYFTDFGYRVKLLGNNNWSLGCRLCF